MTDTKLTQDDIERIERGPSELRTFDGAINDATLKALCALARSGLARQEPVGWTDQRTLDEFAGKRGGIPGVRHAVTGILRNIPHGRDDEVPLYLSSSLLPDTRVKGLGRGEVHSCEDCGGSTGAWFAPNELWNLVMGGPEAKGDPGGFLCPNCFITRAEAQGILPTAWILDQERLVPSPIGGVSEAAMEVEPLGPVVGEQWFQQLAEVPRRAKLAHEIEPLRDEGDTILVNEGDFWNLCFAASKAAQHILEHTALTHPAPDARREALEEAALCAERIGAIFEKDDHRRESDAASTVAEAIRNRKALISEPAK